MDNIFYLSNNKSTDNTRKKRFLMLNKPRIAKILDLDSENGPSQLRLGLVAAFFLYGAFGFLDVFMLSENYKFAWFIRYALITPFLIITFILSYTNIFRKIERPFLVFLVILGQIGILAMIVIAEPSEYAFFGYYAGLILIILWSSFVFQFTVKETLVIVICTILFYNIVAIMHQGLLAKGIQSKEFAWLLGNNFFTIGTGLLALIGSHHLLKSKQALREENVRFKEAKEKAEVSDQLKTSFLQNISHEIRTPMNSILGFINLLQEPDLSDDEKHEYFEIIRMSSDRMLNTMHNIIEVAKFESRIIETELSNFDVNVEVNQLIELIEPQARSKHLSIHTEIADIHNKLIIHSDKNKLRIILFNLLDNAIKFTVSGSITIGYTQQADAMHFYIKDTGIGIETDKQQEVFERFMQADSSTTRRYEGAGLGLTLAKAYTELLGGSISLDSKPGNGSTFRVVLPCGPISVVEKYVDSTYDTLPEAEKQHLVLIVEDDDANAFFLKSALRISGLKVIEAANGKEAVDICKYTPLVKLILMDLKMPVMDGFEATRRIRQFNKEVIIIAQTAYAFSDDRQKAMQAGCNDYMAKPTPGKQLLKMVKDYLA